MSKTVAGSPKETIESNGNGNGDGLTVSLDQAVEDELQPEVVKKENPKKYNASIYTATATLPHDFATSVLELEKLLNMRIFLLVQNKGEKFSSIDEDLYDAFLKSLDNLPCEKPIALLIDSPGGYANCAFKIAKLFMHQCNGFCAIVPRYAKSAATLLTLGADAILLGRHAELGPLDAQFTDREREATISALDEVQALERLHAFALDAADRAMFLLYGRTGKKIETLLPMSLHFVSEMVRPLFENIDAVHYTQMSRALKVAEEYAIRLLRNRYAEDKARKIARHLVEKYPEHGFVIDTTEATSIDIDLVGSFTTDQQLVVNKMLPLLSQLTAIGYVKEASNA